MKNKTDDFRNYYRNDRSSSTSWCSSCHNVVRLARVRTTGYTSSWLWVKKRRKRKIEDGKALVAGLRRQGVATAEGKPRKGEGAAATVHYSW
ncbi:hypothetical protein KQX54_019266 [Cotesia glomerata]|uniref:Uncharacterized protein n=1 Tax=Cotesia glomerata TaxID=32391 RepID=A0AAV7IDP6_COTGL|nr:hypothetical protein KQX54_019266 [Cotesia glomerata]